MSCLVDTNLLVRLANVRDPSHRLAIDVLGKFRAESSCHCAAQNFVELWNVLTRPVERNGLGRHPEAAARLCGHLQAIFPVVGEPTAVFRRWFSLVARYEVRGVKVHDARLVAVMLTHSIDTILTFNAADFRRFEPEGIEVVDPREL